MSSVPAATAAASATSTESNAVAAVNTAEMTLTAALKATFTRMLPVVAIRVPLSLTAKILPALAKAELVYKHKQQRSVVADATSATAASAATHNLVLLGTSVRAADDLPTAVVSLLAEHAAADVTVSSYNVLLDYDSFSADEVLHTLLSPPHTPSAITVPSSFETIGHIAHLNLSEQQLPYKHLIASVLLSKHTRSISSVINKLGSINNTYRVFDMEVIAGSSDMNVVMNEHGCVFAFNFAEVYWNSKLSTEHTRIVAIIKNEIAATAAAAATTVTATALSTQHTVLLDMCCGIGPFVLPAAVHAGCTVYANDLNPKSIQYLIGNINNKRNGVAHLLRNNSNSNNSNTLSAIPLQQQQQQQQQEIRVFNMDARVFVRHIRDQQLLSAALPFNHVLLNLPALSITLLDVFVGLYSDSNSSSSSGNVIATITDKHITTAVEADGVLTMTAGTTATAASTATAEASLQRIRERMPLIHVHCFAASADAATDAIERIQQQLGGYTFTSIMHTSPHKTDLAGIAAGAAAAVTAPTTAKATAAVVKPAKAKHTSAAAAQQQQPYFSSEHSAYYSDSNTTEGVVVVHFVRDVAPKKVMLCVSFRLPVCVAFGNSNSNNNSNYASTDTDADVDSESSNGSNSNKRSQDDLSVSEAKKLRAERDM